MGNFNGDHGSRRGHHSSFAGRGSFNRNGGGGFNRGGRNDKQMYNAVCSNCGKDCQVPFRPTGEKPVYCSSCFEEMGGRDDRRSSNRSGHGDRDLYITQFESINERLDKILNLLQKTEITDNTPQEMVVPETSVEDKKPKSKKLAKK